MTIINLNRSELTKKTRRDFQDGTLLRVGKYLIRVNGLKTSAELWDRPMISLQAYQMPTYIHDFVF